MIIASSACICRVHWDAFGVVRTQLNGRQLRCPLYERPQVVEALSTEVEQVPPMAYAMQQARRRIDGCRRVVALYVVCSGTMLYFMQDLERAARIPCKSQGKGCSSVRLERACKVRALPVLLKLSTWRPGLIASPSILWNF